MTFSLFDLFHYTTTSFNKLHDEVNTSAPITRKPLGYFEKRRLEKKFYTECPEFNEVGRKKASGEFGATSLGLFFGTVMGIYSSKRSYQPISGAVLGVLTFVATRHALLQLHPWISGYGPNLREYNRAFSLWVMYTQLRPRPFDLPIYDAKRNLEVEIAQYKAKKMRGLTPYELEQSKKGELVL